MNQDSDKNENASKCMYDINNLASEHHKQIVATMLYNKEVLEKNKQLEMWLNNNMMKGENIINDIIALNMRLQHPTL
jgi:hypothetical protein